MRTQVPRLAKDNEHPLLRFVSASGGDNEYANPGQPLMDKSVGKRVNLIANHSE